MSDPADSPLPTPLGALADTLAGVRVIDLSRNLPGPFCTRLLADMGAEVLKVEPPAGDPARAIAPLYAALNEGKTSLRVDFHDAAQVTDLADRIAAADVVLDSFRPGTMDAMGLGFEALSQRNPKLVAASITAYGQYGAWAARAGHDINIMAVSGALAQAGGVDGAAILSNVQWADLAGGADMASMQIVAALYAAARSGRGRRLDVSMAQGLYAHLVTPRTTAPLLSGLYGRPPGAGEDVLNGGLPCYGLYATADGRQLAFGALEAKFWRAACEILDRPDWTDRHWLRGHLPGSADAISLRAELAALIAAGTLAEWTARFDGADACVTPVLTLAEAVDHPLFRSSASDRVEGGR